VRAKTGVSTERRYIALEWVTASLAALTYAFCVWLAIYFAIMMVGARPRPSLLCRLQSAHLCHSHITHMLMASALLLYLPAPTTCQGLPLCLDKPKVMTRCSA
jgi:hypothetical protein